MTGIIDGHAHVGTWDEPGFAGRSTTLAEAVALYARLGYAGALVTTTDRAESRALDAALAARSNDTGGPVLRHAWWVDPRRDDDRAALEAALPRVAALKIHPSFLRRPLGDPAFVPYLALAARTGRPVVVHCGRWREVAGFEHALAVARRHPDVRFVLGHMGGDEPLLVRACVRSLVEGRDANVWLGTESLRQYWVVQEALDALGPYRLVFGSDYNLNHPAAFRAVVDALEADAEARARILGGNLDALMPPGLRFGGPQSAERRDG